MSRDVRFVVGWVIVSQNAQSWSTRNHKPLQALAETILDLEVMEVKCNMRADGFPYRLTYTYMKEMRMLQSLSYIPNCSCNNIWVIKLILHDVSYLRRHKDEGGAFIQCHYSFTHASLTLEATI